jgi:hypothetical protein
MLRGENFSAHVTLHEPAGLPRNRGSTPVENRLNSHSANPQSSLFGISATNFSKIAHI